MIETPATPDSIRFLAAKELVSYTDIPAAAEARIANGSPADTQITVAVAPWAAGLGGVRKQVIDVTTPAPEPRDAKDVPPKVSPKKRSISE